MFTMISGYKQSTVRLWHLDNGKWTHICQHNNDNITTFYTDGKLVGVCENQLYNPTFLGKVAVENGEVNHA